MNECNDIQYERIARKLDGEPVELTPQEQAAADEILAAEGRLDLSVAEPSALAAVAKARRRLSAELARPNVRWRRVALAGAAAAAAAVVLAVVLAGPSTAPKSVVDAHGTSNNIDGYLRTLDSISEDQAQAPHLDGVVSGASVDSWPAALDLELKALDSDIHVFYLQDAGGYAPEG